MKSLSKMRRGKFTLIEVFIVFVITMILFSLLIHGFTLAKELARKSFCLNNIQNMSKITTMYNMDNGATPYSSKWLVDFSFLAKYTKSFAGIAVCPSTENIVSTETDLVGNTSYHYMGSREDWSKNNDANGDGSEYGFDSSNPSILNLLSARSEKIIYDKTDTVHHGRFNVVFIESNHAETFSENNFNEFWFVTPTGMLNFSKDDTPDYSRNCNRYRHRYRNTFTNGNGNGFGDINAGNGNGNGNGNQNGDPSVPGDDPEAPGNGGGNGGGDNPGAGNGNGNGNGGGNAKIRIMHIPPGNPGNAHIIQISINAWPAHQAHGDYIVE